MPRHANHLMCVCSYCACTTTTAGSFSHIDSHELAPVNTPEEAWNAHRNADAKHVELMSHVGVWGMGDVVKPLGLGLDGAVAAMCSLPSRSALVVGGSFTRAWNTQSPFEIRSGGLAVWLSAHDAGVEASDQPSAASIEHGSWGLLALSVQGSASSVWCDDAQGEVLVGGALTFLPPASGSSRSTETCAESHHDFESFLTPASGLKWLNVGASRPAVGQRLTNVRLAQALQTRMSSTDVDIEDYFRPASVEFNESEWSSFGIANLHMDHFIEAGTAFFVPAEADSTDSGVGGGSGLALLDLRKGMWRAVAGDEGVVGGQVLAMATSGDDLFVGGDFVSVGGVAAHGLAVCKRFRHVGSAKWFAVAELDGSVRAMTRQGVNVFFAGDFSRVNGVPARVARVNGGMVGPLDTAEEMPDEARESPIHKDGISEGQEQGSVRGGKVLALALVEGAETLLYAGGTFQEHAVRWRLVASEASTKAKQHWQREHLDAVPGPVRAVIPTFPAE